MLGDISRALRPAHPTSKSTDHKRWDTEIRMYAGVIRSAVHTRFRRGVTIAVVHSGFKPDKACLRGVEKMRPVTPQVPPLTGLFDRVGPAGNATRRPIHAAGWRQDKSVHLCTAEDYFCEGKHIGGPIEEFVGNGGSRQGVPDGSRRRLLPAETQLQHFLFLVGHSRLLSALNSIIRRNEFGGNLLLQTSGHRYT